MRQEEIIHEKIKEIIVSEKRTFERIEIRIECPLDSGIGMKAKGICGNERFDIRVEGLRPFFKFVEARKRDSSEKFNVMEISVLPNGEFTVATSFDGELQKLAEEMTK